MLRVTTPTTTTMRERVVAAAAELTAEHGWAAITMAKLAGRVGVSRQTVYDVVGSKPALGEAMVLHELGKFLDAVGAALDAHPDDVVEAIRAAARDVLELARNHALLQAIVTASYGAETQLLPLLTTQSDVLLDTAKATILDRLPGYELGLDPVQLDAAIDVVVRVVLSHVMHPGGEPARVADDIAWISARVLRAE